MSEGATMVKRRKGYPADSTCQIIIAEAPGQDSGLVVHEAREDGLPACGTPVRDWHGKPAVCEQRGSGHVTCLRCGR